MKKLLVQTFTVLLLLTTLMCCFCTEALAATKPKPINKIETSISTNYIKLSWKKVSNVSGYRIYQYDSENESWNVIKNTSKNYYTIKNLTPSKKYYFSIRTYAKNKNGKIILGESKKITSATKPNATSKITSTSTSNTINLKWTKVANATGYKIYMYDPYTDEYQALKTTKNNSYTIKNLNSATSYTFAIRSYFKANSKLTTWSKYKKFNTATIPNKINNIISTSYTNSIDLSWDEVQNVDGYCIYQYDFENGWKKIASTNNNSYSIKNLSSGTDFIFNIKSYFKSDSGKLYYSEKADDDCITFTLPDNPNNLRATVENTNVLLEWDTVENATGYQLYYYDTNYQTLYYIGEGNENYCWIYDLSPESSYIFYVRSYILLSENKYLESEVDSKIEIITEKDEYTAKLEEYNAYKKIIDNAIAEIKAEGPVYSGTYSNFSNRVMELSNKISNLEWKLNSLAGDNSMSAAAQRARYQSELDQYETELNNLYESYSRKNRIEALESELEGYYKSLFN